MNYYNQDNDFGISFSNLIGIFLAAVGVGVLLWVAVSIYQLFTDSSAFFMLDNLIPEEIIVGQFPDGALFVPREFFVYGVPLAALSIGGRIGIAMLKSGVSLFEKPEKK